MHHAGRVPVARHSAEGRGLVEYAQVLAGKGQRDCRDVLLEIHAPLRPDNRHDVAALRQDPRETELRGRASLLSGNCFDPFDQRQIAFEVFPLKARCIPPEIVMREIIRGADTAAEEPAPERAVRDEANPQLAARGKQTAFGIACEQGYWSGAR